MSEKENFYAALVVLGIGILFHVLIPFQVSTEPIPGSRGFVIVSPSTLPRLASWGLVIVGIAWAIRSFLRMRRGQGRTSRAAASDEMTALEDKRWLWSIVVWVSAIVYAFLIPVVGYTEASIAFGLGVALTMLWARPEGLKAIPWPGILIGVCAFPIVLYVVFHKFFYVTLAVGPLSALLGH